MDKIDENNFFWMLMIALFCLLIASLSGCALSPAGVGNAQYSYQHTSDGNCTLTVNSARALEDADVSIQSDCTVAVKSSKAGADQAYLGAIQTLAGAIPAIAGKAVAP